MFVFAACVGSEARFEDMALAGIRATGETDAQVERKIGFSSIATAYNEVLDAASARDDLEATVLLHEDTEIRDPAFGGKVRAAFADPDVAVLGVIGARRVRSLYWWHGEMRGRVVEPRGTLDFGSGRSEVDAVDGLLLVLSPWATRNLRFDTVIGRCFHGYDLDICFSARSGGRRVLVEDIEVHHHTKGGFGNRLDFIRADVEFRRKWRPPATLLERARHAVRLARLTAAPSREWSFAQAGEARHARDRAAEDPGRSSSRH